MLPGGVWRRGERCRDYAFLPVTGELELALAEAAGAGASTPAQITAVLAAALSRVGGEPATLETVRELTVADRQFLARQLAARLGRDGLWLTADCRACGDDFDFHIQQSDLPVKEAGDGALRASVETSLGTCHFRVPTGADQEAVSEIADEAAARRALVGQCLTGLGEGSVPDDAATALTEQDLEHIEAGLEKVAPEVALRATMECPECEASNKVWLDPYVALRHQGADLFHEIHELASAYHWSEAEILRMPRSRRHVYLQLVERARGMVQ